MTTLIGMMVFVGLIGWLLAIRHFLYMRELRRLRAIRAQWLREVREQEVKAFKAQLDEVQLWLEKARLYHNLAAIEAVREALKQNEDSVRDIGDFVSLNLTKLEEDLQETVDLYPSLKELADQIKVNVELCREELWKL